MSARDLPIQMSPPMVRAILREIERPGTGKTQTRRLFGGIERDGAEDWHIFSSAGGIFGVPEERVSLYAPDYVRVAVGDRLWVREAWRTEPRHDHQRPADLAPGSAVLTMADTGVSFPSPLWGKFRQAMHMPRWASRLTLIVTDVQVQRLQDISEADAQAEGVERVLYDGTDPAFFGRYGYRDYRDHPHAIVPFILAQSSFQTLWNHINAGRGHGWDSNPWVAAYTFRPIAGNIDQVQP